MKALFLAVLFAAVSTSPQPSLAVTPAPAAKSTPALMIELSIPAPLHEVWEAFTTKEGLSTWLTPDVSVELKPGGDWLVKFNGSTGGGTIVSFVPEEELVIDALAPDRFPLVRAARTRAVFTFTANGDSTVVRLSQQAGSVVPNGTLLTNTSPRAMQKCLACCIIASLRDPPTGKDDGTYRRKAC